MATGPGVNCLSLLRLEPGHEYVLLAGNQRISCLLLFFSCCSQLDDSEDSLFRFVS